MDKIRIPSYGKLRELSYRTRKKAKLIPQTFAKIHRHHLSNKEKEGKKKTVLEIIGDKIEHENVINTEF